MCRRVEFCIILGALISIAFMTAPVIVKASLVSDHSSSTMEAASFVSEFTFSTYIGGQGWDIITDIAIDNNSDIYLVGYTEATDFPTTEDAYDRFHNGGNFDLAPIDAFVMKLSADGQEIIYSTFLGGSGDDYAIDIAVDESGNAYVVGKTDSSNFPTVNAYDDSHNSGEDCFVTKLSSDGSEILFSTFIGGSGNDCGYNLELDNVGDCIVVGETSSSDFPVQTTNLQPSCHSLGDDEDGFVIKLSADGSTLNYSMYLGVGFNEETRGVSIDIDGNAVIIGSTGASDFPMVNALDDTLDGTSDCFIMKVNASGHIIFSTFYGGSDTDFTRAVSIGDSGQIYITGGTYGGSFPLVGVENQIFNFTRGIFILIMDSMGTEIIFSGVLTNSATEDDFSGASNLVVISEHELWLGGYTECGSFPTTEDAFDRTFQEDEGFIAMVDPVSCTLNYSSFFGGGDLDSISGLAVNEEGDIVAAGRTRSLDIPIYNALEPEKIGSEYDNDGFVFRLELEEIPPGWTLDTLTVIVAGVGIGFVTLAIVIVVIRMRNRI